MGSVLSKAWQLVNQVQVTDGRMEGTTDRSCSQPTLTRGSLLGRQCLPIDHEESTGALSNRRSAPVALCPGPWSRVSPDQPRMAGNRRSDSIHAVHSFRCSGFRPDVLGLLQRIRILLLRVF